MKTFLGPIKISPKKICFGTRGPNSHNKKTILPLHLWTLKRVIMKRRMSTAVVIWSFSQILWFLQSFVTLPNIKFDSPVMKSSAFLVFFVHCIKNSWSSNRLRLNTIDLKHYRRRDKFGKNMKSKYLALGLHSRWGQLPQNLMNDIIDLARSMGGDRAITLLKFFWVCS